MTAAATQIVGYARVSSEGQNLDRQLVALKDAGAVKVYEDKASGKTTAGRPGFDACMSYLREGDTLVVASMDRLARNLADLLSIADDLTGRGVSVRFIKEGMTLGGKGDASTRLLLSVFGAVAEFERALIHERQAEGIAIAKEKGIYKGGVKHLDDSQIADLKAQAAAGVPKTKIAKAFGIDRTTVYRYLKD